MSLTLALGCDAHLLSVTKPPACREALEALEALTFGRPGRWFGPLDGNNDFTAADFDRLLGHSVAVTDAAASVFAAELIAAYPEAKVVLNYRRDLDAWSVSSDEFNYKSRGREHDLNPE